MAEEPAGGERVVGEEEHHGKKSMFKRVKDRAKKLKGTVEKKMYDGEHEEEEEETEPDVHGAPEVHRAPDVHGAPKDRLESTSPGNYQTKDGDSTNTGGDEAGILPSFQEMKIHDEPESKPLHTSPTSEHGTHDQFSSDPPETKRADSASETFEQTKFESVPEQSKVESVSESFNNQAEKNKREPVPENVSGGEKSFTEKIYGQVASVPEQSKVESVSESFNNQAEKNKREPVPENVSGGEKNFTEKIYGQVASVPEQSKVESVPEQSKVESVPESFDDQEEKNKREPVPENVSGGKKSYTEMIYGKVASKFGYGDGGSATPAVEGERETDQKQTGVVTEKPGPLDGKVADKKVSVKDSVMEKLKPGEEDKALSEVITEKFHAKKEDSSEIDGVSPGKATGTGSDEPATGYMGRLKGAVTSIFGGSAEAPESPVSEKNRNQPAAAAEEAKIDQVGGEELEK